jgi:hypothetical protein
MWDGSLSGCHSTGVKDDVVAEFGSTVSSTSDSKSRVSRPFGRMKSVHVRKAFEVWVRMRMAGIWPKVLLRVRKVGIRLWQK